MRCACGLTVFAAAAGTAHADLPRVPIGVAAALGGGIDAAHNVTFSEMTASANGATTANTSPSLFAKVDLGFRLDRDAMVSAHISLGTPVGQRNFELLEFKEFGHTVIPLQLGVGGLFMVDDRIYVTGWFGVQRAWQHETAPVRTDWSVQKLAPACGASIGADVYVLGDHRLTAAFAAAYVFAGPDIDGFRYTFTTLSIDLGYRFWALE